MKYKEMAKDVFESSLLSYERLKRELYEETKKRISICENDLEEKKAVKESLTKQLLDAEEEFEVLNMEFSNLTESIGKMKDNLTQLNQESSELLFMKNQLMDEKKNEKDEIKKKYQAYCTALAYYKKCLHCYIDIEKDIGDLVIFSFYFFVSEKRDTTNNYFVRFEISSGKWKVIDMKPEVNCANEIYRYLEKTSDTLGFLSHVRSLFMKKKEEEERAKQN